jgi:putative acetyltransferase
MKTQLAIGPDDPRVEDVRALLARRLAFSHEVTPPGHVHALALDGLLVPAVTFYSARIDGELAGVGALREIDYSHGEIKSMHTADAFRRRGIARAMVEHILVVAQERGYRRVSLETGTMDAFAQARALYRTVGFTPCEPFGEYTRNPHSICMTLVLRAQRP